MLTKYLDPKNDVAFRKIFGTEKHKNILIHFLNDMVCFSGKEPIVEVTFLKTVQDPEIAAKKESIVDVLCKDSNGVQYIVEMQVAEAKGFEKRAQYYAAKAYAGQLNKGKEEDGQYKNLKEVIFISIANFILFPDKKAYKSDHVILDTVTGEHNLKGFSFTFLELPKFHKTIDDKLDNMVEKWCIFFKHANEMNDTDLEKLMTNGDIIIKDAYVALDRFNWTAQELLAYEQELKRIWDNAAVEEARKEKEELRLAAVIAEGEKKAAECLEKGREEGIKTTAINMLKQNLELDFISQITELSAEEIHKLKISQKP